MSPAHTGSFSNYGFTNCCKYLLIIRTILDSLKVVITDDPGILNSSFLFRK